MNAPGHDCFRPPVQPHAGPSDTAAGRSRRPASLRVDWDADVAATDWQITLHLKALFERDPALISSLLNGTDSEQPAAHALMILAAAREALAAHPDSIDLHYQAAKVAAQVGHTHTAEALLRRMLEMDPNHVGGLVLLADVCIKLSEPQLAVACLHRALMVREAQPGLQSSAGCDRRGNELLT